MNRPSRRLFLRDAATFSAGALASAWWLRPFSGPLPFAAAEEPTATSAEERVRTLGLQLPKPTASRSLLAPAVRTGNLLFVSGHVPKDAEGKSIVGKVGRDMDTAAAAAAARQVALTVLGVVRAELGSLDQVTRLVKVLGMVNCTADYAETPLVVNGFSQLLIDVFGEKIGKGARSAVGMSSLPGGVPVEVEAIFEVRG